MERNLFLEGNAFSPGGVIALRISPSKSLPALYSNDPQLSPKTVFLTEYTQWDTPQRAEIYVKHLNAEDILQDLKLLLQ